jgi:hypothetical protein
MSSEKAAAGSFKDPVVLGDSGDDENAPTTSTAAARAKRPPSPSVATAKRPKMSSSPDCEDHNGGGGTASSSTATAESTPQCIQPMTPVSDPFAGQLTGYKSAYVIYMAIEEDKTGKFYSGIEKCAKNCSKDIHEKCMQMEGTRHVTLWNGQMTDADASEIQFSEASQPKMPIEIHLEGWISWNSGNYLKVASSTTAKLKNMMDQLKGLPDGAKPKCDHLSLYRKRGAGREGTVQLARVRKALENHDWGSVQGASVRIKVVGTDYNECRVLAGV